jgi:glucosylceramidase
MGDKIRVIQTAKDTQDRLTEKESLVFREIYDKSLPFVEINKHTQYQEILGFGGAFTEAGSVTLDQLSSEKRQEAIEAYFHPEKGINYTFCRTHINSCDFSLGNYAYTETPDDVELNDFTIERDRKSLIPLIKEAIKVKGEGLKLFASPWSPPFWMKTNGRMNNGGSLKDEYREIWAKYFGKYVKAYKEEGIDIWGVTIQNEPMAITPWDNCVYTDEQERDFVKILGPTLSEEGLNDVKIMVWDHNKDIMKSRVDTIMSDPEAAKWVWGVGFHWYGPEDSKSTVNNDVLDYTYRTYKTNLVFTEGCNPYYNIDKDNLIGEWWTGEKYGRHIIGDLNHWTVAWCDWNMYLNEKGGPNHVENLCDAPIMADRQKDILYYNTPYYYMGHFSKYILPGAKRVEWKSCIQDLNITAFENIDGSIAVVVMNEADEGKTFVLKNENKAAEVVIPAHSIQTLIY